MTKRIGNTEVSERKGVYRHFHYSTRVHNRTFPVLVSFTSKCEGKKNSIDTLLDSHNCETETKFYVTLRKHKTFNNFRGLRHMQLIGTSVIILDEEII